MPILSRALPPLHPRDAVILQAGAAHLHHLGARATYELLAEIGAAHDCLPAMLDTLGRYRRLSRSMIVPAGADRFPHRLAVVPC